MFFKPHPAESLRGYQSSMFKMMAENKAIGKRLQPELLTFSRNNYAKLPTSSHTDSAPHLSGLNILVTGATSGLGQGIAAHFLNLGANLLLPCRSTSEKFVTLKKNLLEYAGQMRERYMSQPVLPEYVEKLKSKVSFVTMDLSDFDSISSGFKDISSNPQFQHFDAVVHNAGLINSHAKLSRQGIQVCCAVNSIAPILLTELLIKHKMLTTSDEKNSASKVLFVSSEEYRASDLIDFESSFSDQKCFKDGSFSNIAERYAMSKMLLALYSKTLARHRNLISFDMCPGAVASNISGREEGIWKYFGFVVGLIMKFELFGFVNPGRAALPYVRLVVENDMDEFNGCHLQQGMRKEHREDVDREENQEWMNAEVKKICEKYILV